MPDRVIDVENLLFGHALSLTNQPHLRSLVDAVSRQDKPLLVVAGAGVSMDAGLPSWTDLVGGLVDQCGEAVARRVRTLESSSPQRQAQVSKSLVMRVGSQSPSARTRRWRNRLARVLYRGSSPQPGLIAEAIARLVAVHPDSRVVTTNFDRTLDVALASLSGAGDSTRDMTLADVKMWLQLPGSPPPVLHLHGVVGPRGTSRGPIVLTESDFHEHGARVQDALMRLVRQRLVIFVGVSMTDPNLVGPLSRVASEGEDHYVILVPTRTALGPGPNGLDDDECARFAVDQARMLEEMLGVRPILLKSFAQVPQVLSELALASRVGAAYRRSTAPGSDGLEYGERYASALADWYSGLGADPGTGRLGYEAASALTTRFRALVQADDGPDGFLREVLSRVDTPPHLERLAYYVWLRETPRRSETLVRERATDFRLRLMAASIYVHLDDWARDRLEVIDAESPFVAVQAIHHGRSVMRDFPPRGRTGWRSAFATPLIESGYRSSEAVADQVLDRLLLGVVSVNTNLSISGEGEAKSVLGHLTLAEQLTFESLVRNSAVRLLTPIFGSTA